MLLFPLYISAQDINPDSAFVDTVQEWHLKDHEWYKERMKIASVKAIKDICDDYAQSTYNSLNKIKENLIECLRLGKKDPYLFVSVSTIAYCSQNKKCVSLHLKYKDERYV